MRETEILRGLHKAKGYAHGTPFVRGKAGDDKVPAHLTRGEAVLPAKTVRTLGSSNIARMIASTNDGQAPKRGLRAGGHYINGLVETPEQQGARSQFLREDAIANSTDPATSRATLAAQTQAQGNAATDAVMASRALEQPNMERALASAQSQPATPPASLDKFANAAVNSQANGLNVLRQNAASQMAVTDLNTRAPLRPGVPSPSVGARSFTPSAQMSPTIEPTVSPSVAAPTPAPLPALTPLAPELIAPAAGTPPVVEPPVARTGLGGAWDSAKKFGGEMVDGAKAKFASAPPVAPGEMDTNGRIATPQGITDANNLMKWSMGGKTPGTVNGTTADGTTQPHTVPAGAQGTPPPPTGLAYKPTSYATQMLSDAAKKAPAGLRLLGGMATAYDAYGRVKTVGDVASNPNATPLDVGTSAAEQGSQMAGGLAAGGVGATAALGYGAPLIAGSGPFAPLTAAGLAIGGGVLGYMGGTNAVKGATWLGRKAVDGVTGGDTANTDVSAIPRTPVKSVQQPTQQPTQQPQQPVEPFSSDKGLRGRFSEPQQVPAQQDATYSGQSGDARRADLMGLQKAREAQWHGPGEGPGHWRQGMMPDFGKMSSNDLIAFRGQAANAGDWTGMLASRDALRYKSKMDELGVGRQIQRATFDRESRNQNREQRLAQLQGLNMDFDGEKGTPIKEGKNYTSAYNRLSGTLAARNADISDLTPEHIDKFHQLNQQAGKVDNFNDSIQGKAWQAFLGEHPLTSRNVTDYAADKHNSGALVSDTSRGVGGRVPDSTLRGGMFATPSLDDYNTDLEDINDAEGQAKAARGFSHLRSR